MIFKVAVLQMRSENRAVEENRNTIIKYMTKAKINNADILLLPECFITGYDLTIDNDAAISEGDLAALCDKAKELGIGLVATALTKGKKSEKPSKRRFCDRQKRRHTDEVFQSAHLRLCRRKSVGIGNGIQGMRL